MLHSRISCLHYPYVIRQAGDQPWNLKASHPEPALALLTKPNLRQAKWELRVFAPLHAMDSTVARARTPTHSAQHTHTHTHAEKGSELGRQKVTCMQVQFLYKRIPKMVTRLNGIIQ